MPLLSIPGVLIDDVSGVESDQPVSLLFDDRVVITYVLGRDRYPV